MRGLRKDYEEILQDNRAQYFSFLHDVKKIEWKDLSLEQKYFLKQIYCDGFEGDTFRERGRFPNNWLGKGSETKIIKPTYGPKFFICLPNTLNFLKNIFPKYIGAGADFARVFPPKLPDLLIDTDDFDELFNFCEYFPSFFSYFYLDKHIKKITRTNAIKIMRKHKKIYRVLPDHLKKDKEIIQLALIRRGSSILAYTPKDALNSSDLFKRATTRCIDSLYYFPDSIIKRNSKYIEPNIWRIQHNKTIDKLPKKLCFKYFKLLPTFDYKMIYALPYKKRKHFSIKQLKTYCVDPQTFKWALRSGITNNASLTIQLCNRIIADHNFKGSHLYEAISVLWDNDKKTLKKFVDQRTSDYVNFIVNKFSMMQKINESRDVHKNCKIFGEINIFKLAVFEKLLSARQKKQLLELKQYYDEIGCPIFLSSLHEDDIPF